MKYYNIILFLFMYLLIGCSNKVTKRSHSKEELLVGKVWKVEEIISNVSCKNLHFLKDSINTTGYDYTPFQLTFNLDGTGTYTDGLGITYETKWSFTSKDHHNMKLIVTPQLTYAWSMVEISENSFQTISTLTLGDQDILQSSRYVPIKQ